MKKNVKSKNDENNKINIQEKKEKQYYNNKHLKNEIDWYEIKKKSNEKQKIKFNIIKNISSEFSILSLN